MRAGCNTLRNFLCGIGMDGSLPSKAEMRHPAPWGLGLHGVVAILAIWISAGFNSLKLH